MRRNILNTFFGLAVVMFSMSSCVLTSDNNIKNPTSNLTFEIQEITKSRINNTIDQNSNPIMSTEVLTQQTIPPVVTKIPVFDVNVAEKEFIRLLHDNGGCELPCFLGFIPGESTTQSLNLFMKSFENITVNGLSLQITNDNEIIQTNIYYEKDSELASGKILWMKITTEAYKWNGQIKEPLFNNSHYKEYFDYYNLANLLSKFGLPSDVYITYVPGNPIGNMDQLFLYLNYVHLGWFAKITMPGGWDGETGFEGCPNYGFTELTLWEPGKKNWLNFGSSNPGRFMDETGISFEQFAEKYLIDSSTCFEINLLK